MHLERCFFELLRARRERDFEPLVRNFLFNVPPRSLKSEIVNVFFPAWTWLHDPAIQLLCLSYNPDVASRDARSWRDLIISQWYESIRAHAVAAAELQPWTIGVIAALRRVRNTAGGLRAAKGLNAVVMGENSDILIIDDPHDPRGEGTHAMRQTIARYAETVHNRVNDFKRCMRVGIMQRLHHEDWSAHVLSAGDWEHVMIPMEFEPERARTTVYGWRDPRSIEGELLHEARYSREWCEAEKVRPGFGYAWAGQMQQSPSPRGGGMFQRAAWRFWKPDGVAAPASPRPFGCWEGDARALPAKLERVVLSLDASFRAAAHNDRNVITMWGAAGADLYLLERVSGHFDAPRCAAELRLAVGRARAWWQGVPAVLVELGGNGQSVVDYLKHEVRGIVEVRPTDSKESRAAAVQSLVAGGNVYLPEGAPWLDQWIEEFAAFPVGSHDDQVDSFTQAANWMQANAPTSWSGKAFADPDKLERLARALGR